MRGIVSHVLNLQANTCLKLLYNLRTTKYPRNNRVNSKYRLAHHGGGAE
jgi:hypothetical protein